MRDRKSLDFHGLCCGKLSLDDMKRPKIINGLKKEKNLIPPFMEDFDSYMRALDIIAETNHIDLNTNENNKTGGTAGQLTENQSVIQTAAEEQKQEE